MRATLEYAIALEDDGALRVLSNLAPTLLQSPLLANGADANV
jgi:hypothetical protein